MIELNKTLLEQEAEIERLTEECSTMSQKFSKDPEFIRFVANSRLQSMLCSLKLGSPSHTIILILPCELKGALFVAEN